MFPRVWNWISEALNSEFLQHLPLRFASYWILGNSIFPVYSLHFVAAWDSLSQFCLQPGFLVAMFILRISKSWEVFIMKKVQALNGDCKNIK